MLLQLCFELLRNSKNLVYPKCILLSHFEHQLIIYSMYYLAPIYLYICNCNAFVFDLIEIRSNKNYST